MLAGKFSDSLDHVNSDPLIAPVSEALSNEWVRTIDQIRRENLERLAAMAGSMSALASRTGAAAAYLSQVKTGSLESKTKKPRSIGDSLARRLEVAMGVGHGWMDQDHAGHVAVQPSSAYDALSQVGGSIRGLGAERALPMN